MECLPPGVVSNFIARVWNLEMCGGGPGIASSIIILISNKLVLQEF